MDSRGKDPCCEVCCGARGLSHRAGDPCRAAPEVPLGEAWQEERGEWQRSSHGQGREITSSTGRTSFPQWENMCISSPRIGNQEDLHSDGGPKMHHGKAPSTRRASTGCGTHDALGLSRQGGCSHRYGEGFALQEATPGKVQPGVRELPNATIRQGPTAVLQLSEVWPHGQDMLERKPDMQVLCWRPSSQCKGGSQVTLKCANCGKGHATTRKACPKRLTLVNKSKVTQKKVERTEAPAPPTKNAWTKKYVPTMEDFPKSLTAVWAPPTLKHTLEVSRPQVARPKPVATKTVVTDQQRKTPKVPHPVQRKEESQRCGVTLKSQSNPQEEEIEAITIALDGTTALLRRVSTRKSTLSRHYER